MEAASGTLLETLHQAKASWKDEKKALELQLEGSQNAAIENWVQCRSLRVEIDDLESLKDRQAQELGGQVISLRGQLRTRTGERDSVVDDLATRTGERNLAITRFNATSANLTIRTQERDSALARLNATSANLATRTEERDSAFARLNATSANLAIRTEERDRALQELDLTLENMAEQSETKKAELEEAREEFEQKIWTLEEEMGNMVSKDVYNELQVKYENEKALKSQHLDAWSRVHCDNNDLRQQLENMVDLEEHIELQQVCDSRVDPEEHRRLQELCNSKVNQLVGAQQQLQALQNDLTTNHSNGACVKRDRFLSAQQQLQDLQPKHTNGACVDRAEFTALQQKFNGMESEHALCHDKVDRSDFMSVQQELQHLQSQHNNGAFVNRADFSALQQNLEDIKLQHALCGDMVDRSTFNAVQQTLRGLESQHTDGACVDRATYVGIEQELQNARSEHALCVDKVDRSQLVGLEQQIRTWESNHGDESCVTRAAFTSLQQQFEGLSAAHRSCTSIGEVQTLREIESQHGTCIDRATHENLFNEHQDCSRKTEEAVAAVQQQHSIFASRHMDCVPNNTYAVLLREHRNFLGAHTDCAGLAIQLGQLQEEHGRCNQRFEEWLEGLRVAWVRQ